MKVLFKLRSSNLQLSVHSAVSYIFKITSISPANFLINVFDRVHSVFIFLRNDIGRT